MQIKKLVIFFFVAFTLFTSCQDYGKKVTINETSEVYYDGVGDTLAKKLGDFLLKQGYFTATEERAVQLLKEDDTYIVKFVVNKERFSQDEETALIGFKIWQMWLQDSVFYGAKTKLMLADATMKDIAEVGELTELEKKELTETETITTDLETDSTIN